MEECGDNPRDNFIIYKSESYTEFSVTKKTGKARLVVDYRRLNAQTKRMKLYSRKYPKTLISFTLLLVTGLGIVFLDFISNLFLFIGGKSG